MSPCGGVRLMDNDRGVGETALEVAAASEGKLRDESELW